MDGRTARMKSFSSSEMSHENDFYWQNVSFGQDHRALGGILYAAVVGTRIKRGVDPSDLRNHVERNRRSGGDGAERNCSVPHIRRKKNQTPRRRLDRTP
jgi:hypothetical protein